MRTLLLATSMMLAPLAAMPAAHAATVIDAANDFLPTYAGPKLGDLDVTSFAVSYNSVAQLFTLGATFAADIVPGSEGFYVIGVNTGTGLARPFAALGQPNVIFNQAIVIRKDGTGNIGQTTLDPLNISITGNILTARIALSLLPTTGFGPQDYGFNLWPRGGGGPASQISDFAPENANLTPNGIAAAVPEPASWGMMLVGFAAAGAALRRQRSRPVLA